MDSLFSPEFGLSLWTFVTFLLLVLLLGKFAWKPFLKILDDREKTIRSSVEDAEKSRLAAEEIRKQLEREWASAKEKVQVMIANATDDTRKLREKLVKEAELDVKNILDQGRVQLAAEKEKLSKQLQTTVAVLAVELTEKVLRHPSVMKDRSALVDSLLKELESSKPIAK